MKVNQVLYGDAIEIMEKISPNSIDSLASDIPYGIGFMNKEWDKFTSKEYQNFCFEWGTKAIEVLKPGSYCASFSAPRMYHRMVCGLEEAGFIIKDMINWIYGCLSEDTEILTINGWEHYHKNIYMSPILCYDCEKNTFIFDKPKRVFIYQNKYPAYRIKSDFTDQIISRNHRCIVEREGKFVFQRAETLQSEENIPFLESLYDLPETIYNVQSHSSEEKQDLLKRVFKQENKRNKKKTKTNRTTRGKIKSYLFGMWNRILSKYKAFEASKATMLFKTMQWSTKRRRVEKIWSSWKNRLDRRKHEELSQKNEGPKQSCLERRGYLFQNKGKLYWGKICSLSKRILIYGSKGWLYNGTSFNYGSTFKPLPYSNGNSSSHKPRSFRQSFRESETILQQLSTQTIRRTKAKIKEIEYDGKVWCIEVSTGAFVARRNGKIFITGNSGFPKSLDISKAIDKYYGIETSQKKIIAKNPNFRESHLNPTNTVPMVKSRGIIGIRKRHGGGNQEEYMGMTKKPEIYITKPFTEEAKQWYGWGTGLKPAHEPIVLAQKPYEGTYAENILKWGVGGLNIDACRIVYNKNKEKDSRIYNSEKNITRGSHQNATLKYAPDGNQFPMFKTQKGRWPTNLLLDEESVEMIDQQSGITSTGNINPYYSKVKEPNCQFRKEFFHYNYHQGDKGGASRFFYCPKAFKIERNAGLIDIENIPNTEMVNRKANSKGIQNPRAGAGRSLGAKNNIATLKPINLMRYIVRLITPTGGTVLDPFAGSGTTGIACLIEDFNFILIEKRKRFAKVIIPKRLEYWKDPSHWNLLKDHPLLPKIQNKINKAQNMSLDTWFDKN